MLGKKVFDAAVIGGGVYGCILAIQLKKVFKDVVLIEKEKELLTKASYNNQARIHNGYHYPRSFITAQRSHINYIRFISDFRQAVVDKFQMIYAIASNNSKTTSHQFLNFCHKIGSPISPAPQKIKSLFNNRLIEDVFLVEEVVFNAAKLRKILKERLQSAKVKIFYNTKIIKVTQKGENIIVHTSGEKKIISKLVLNCAYSGINTILKNSSLPILPLKDELTEMPLLKLPPELKRVGITIMDGPFFSIMPFPDKNLHSLHHVRYTPHSSTTKNEPLELPGKSKFIYMIKDAQRYIPSLGKAKQKGSLFEIKTVLLQNEISDARPILFKKNYGMKNFHVILGGKIDNIYDVLEEVDQDIIKD